MHGEDTLTESFLRFIICVFMNGTCMTLYMHHMHAGVQENQKKASNPWKWSYRWL